MDTSNQRILLVEDDFLIAASETLILKKYGFHIIHNSSGEEAIKTLDSGASFDIILMDIDLGPGMDGIETSKIISKNYDIPIIFLSSHTEPEIIQKTERITSYGYIVKNTGETVLIASINMAFRLKKSHEQHRLTFEKSKEEISNALEEKTILMNELQHRVRNSFSMISSFINLEKGNQHSDETKQVLIDLEGRINSLTKLYDLLLKSENNAMISLKEYISYIADSIINSFSKKMDRIQINLDLEDIEVNSKEATSWGLIVNELITNAMKYAFPINQSGSIYVSLKPNDNLIELEVSDTGQGPDKDFSINDNKYIGLGLTIVNLLSKQLHGKIEYSRTDKTNFRIVCSRF